MNDSNYGNALLFGLPVIIVPDYVGPRIRPWPPYPKVVILKNQEEFDRVKAYYKTRNNVERDVVEIVQRLFND